MDKETIIKGITKYIGEDCEMRGLQPNTCFDVPDRACDKCKTAQQTAEKIYNLFCEFAADVRKETAKEICDHIKRDVFPTLYPNEATYLKRYFKRLFLQYGVGVDK